MFDLRSWLRRAPKPKALRLKTPDGEWRVVELSGGRYMWNEIEQTVRTAEATAVECLDADGKILRAVKLSEDDENSEDFEGKGADGKAISKAMKEQASMLDAYGRRLNEAFARGAEAASTSQDKLVALVENLTQHLTLALTNVHTLSTNYARAIEEAARASGAADEPNPGMQLLQTMLTAKLGAGAPAVSSPPEHKNGKK